MDAEIVRRIGDLTDEEHGLERNHEGAPLTGDKLDRLRSLEIALDQCWDLLRQRMARREAGRDPDEATVRSAETVENYLQ